MNKTGERQTAHCLISFHPMEFIFHRGAIHFSYWWSSQQREHILFYEVQSSTSNKTAPTLFWRGCVALPEHAVINDVVALPDGGFAVTHMYNASPCEAVAVSLAILARPCNGVDDDVSCDSALRR